jgi:hypothetical protein
VLVGCGRLIKRLQLLAREPLVFRSEIGYLSYQGRDHRSLTGGAYGNRPVRENLLEVAVIKTLKLRLLRLVHLIRVSIPGTAD